jgi:hypothetical protein
MAVDKNGNPIVIGKNPTTTVKPTTPGSGTVPTQTGLGAAINKGLDNVGVGEIKVDSNITASTWVESLTNKEMNQIIPILKKFGASKTNIADYKSAKNYLKENYPTYIDNSGFNVSKLVKLFEDNATNAASGTSGTTPKGNGVTQYVTKQSPALIAQDVDKFLLSTIGSKNINKDSRDKIMAEINKMIDAGTTTTTTMDKSGKSIVTQTPGYSAERAKEVVSRVAKTAEPAKYEQQQQASFFDFMQTAEQMRGGR